MKTQTERAMTAKMRRTQAPPKTPARMKIWFQPLITYFSWHIFNYFLWGGRWRKHRKGHLVLKRYPLGLFLGEHTTKVGKEEE